MNLYAGENCSQPYAAGARQYVIINGTRFRDALWFRAGAEVTVNEEVRRDVVTTYMQGTPFEALTSPGAVSDGEPGETAFGILQPSANRPSSKIEKQDRAIRLTGPTRTLSFLSRVLLRVPIEFLFAVLTAEIIILTLIL